MGENGLVVIRTFPTKIDADMAKSALDAAHIQAMIRADDAGGLRPHLAFSQGVELIVREEDAERARAILD